VLTSNSCSRNWPNVHPVGFIYSIPLQICRINGGRFAPTSVITQRFGNDGQHARQMLNGSIVGGTGRYRRERGTIVGGRTLIDRAAGLGAVHLRYTLSLR